MNEPTFQELIQKRNENDIEIAALTKLFNQAEAILAYLREEVLRRKQENIVLSHRIITLEVEGEI